MSRNEAPLAALRRRSKSAIIAVASDPDTSNSTRPFSCTVAWKSWRSTAVSSQSFIISSASCRVRPCVSASSIGISANHQRPSRTSFPANLIFASHTPFAGSLARAARSPRRGVAHTPRVRRPSKHRAGLRDAGTAIRTPEAASRAHASSPRIECTRKCVIAFPVPSHLQLVLRPRHDRVERRHQEHADQ